MTPVITIAYQPGAYGSYLSWVIDRFNKFRMAHDPKVPDDPFLPDGSSHGYASHCKIETEESFLDGFYAARETPSLWGYNIYAGWPKGNLSRNINTLLDAMGPSDRLILVECLTVHNHMLRWIRNEATMQKQRWWKMYDITSEDDYEEAFIKDWKGSSHYRSADIRNPDPRLFTCNVQDILERENSWRQLILHDFLKWPIIDKDLYISSSKKFLEYQEPYVFKSYDISNLHMFTEQVKSQKLNAFTPVQKALLNVRRKESLWI